MGREGINAVRKVGSGQIVKSFIGHVKSDLQAEN